MGGILENQIVTPNFGGVLRAPPSSVDKPKEMLSVSVVNGQTIVKVNSSSLSILQSCGRKSFYELEQNWRPLAVQAPLVHGIAVHKAMQVFYMHEGPRTIPENFSHVAPLLAHGHSAPEKHFLYDALLAYVEAAEPLRALPDTDARSLTSGIWVLEHYFRTYLNDQYVIHTDASGPVVEREFETVLWEDAKLRIVLFGTIDFVLRNTVTGEILTGDHKTSSRMGPDFFNRIKPNHQYTGYLLGAHRTLGVSSEHFLVNGIQSKARPLTARGGPPTFTRQITRRTPEDFAEFETSVRDAVGNYLRWQEEERWPLGSVDSCSMWGGCKFLDVCSAPNELRGNILESKFAREQSCSKC